MEYPISDVVLFDNDIAAMTIQSGGTDEWGNITFSILCENKTDKALTFNAENLIVNGWYADGSMYQEVAAGKKAVGTLEIWTSDLEMVGIEDPDKVVMPVRVFDEAGWWDEVFLVDETFTFYPTGLTEGQIVVPERPSAAGETVLADTDDFTMIILGSETDEMWGGFALDAYVRNKTDKTVYFSWEDVSVNGYMIDPYFGLNLPAGQQAVSVISFAVNELEDSGIDQVEEIEFTLQVTEKLNWEELYSEKHTYKP